MVDDSDNYVINFATDKGFRLADIRCRGLEGNSTAGQRRDAISTVSSTIHRPSTCGLSIAEQLLAPQEGF
jgi:hypothetical protein